MPQVGEGDQDVALRARDAQPESGDVLQGSARRSGSSRPITSPTATTSNRGLSHERRPPRPMGPGGARASLSGPAARALMRTASPGR